MQEHFLIAKICPHLYLRQKIHIMDNILLIQWQI